MKNYPQLKEMGITHPDQITKFLINGIAGTDVLRIVYDRRKGSLLPNSRTYKFPRVQKTAVVNKETGQTETVLETNPELVKALAELRDLLEKKQRKECVTDTILEELLLLEEDIALRSSCIRDLVRKI